MPCFWRRSGLCPTTTPRSSPASSWPAVPCPGRSAAWSPRAALAADSHHFSPPGPDLMMFLPFRADADVAPVLMARWASSRLHPHGHLHPGPGDRAGRRDIGISLAVVALGQNLGMFVGPALFGLCITRFGWVLAAEMFIPSGCWVSGPPCCCGWNSRGPICLPARGDGLDATPFGAGPGQNFNQSIDIVRPGARVFRRGRPLSGAGRAGVFAMSASGEKIDTRQAKGGIPASGSWPRSAPVRPQRLRWGGDPELAAAAGPTSPPSPSISGGKEGLYAAVIETVSGELRGCTSGAGRCPGRK
jgi:hypothetical protein